MDEIKKLSELDEKQIDQAMNVFIEGFYNVMRTISKDKNTIYKLFIKSFDRDMTYAYLQDGQAVGFLGVGNYQKRAVFIERNAYLEIIPGFAGKMQYKAVSAAMFKPIIKDPQGVYIDFLATDPEQRGKGIGTKLIEFVRDNLGYKYIELDVFSKNPRAKKLYEREGFKVIEVKRDLLMRMQGYGRRIVMRLEV